MLPWLMGVAALTGAAQAAPLQGADPLLQAQFAQPRCWHSLAATARWAGLGAQALTQGRTWRAEPATSGPRWQPRPDRCVLDRATGLVWAPADMREQQTVAEAVASVTQARERRVCGHMDWRLPSRSELQGLVNYEAAEPDVLPGLGSGSHSLWTAQERHVLTMTTAGPALPAERGRLTVSLPWGQVYTAEPQDRRSVLLVRDGACRALGRGYWW